MDEDCWKCRNETFVTAKVLSDSAETKLEKQDNHHYISTKKATWKLPLEADNKKEDQLFTWQSFFMKF